MGVCTSTNMSHTAPSWCPSYTAARRNLFLSLRYASDLFYFLFNFSRWHKKNQVTAVPTPGELICLSCLLVPTDSHAVFIGLNWLIFKEQFIKSGFCFDFRHNCSKTGFFVCVFSLYWKYNMLISAFLKWRSHWWQTSLLICWKVTNQQNQKHGDWWENSRFSSASESSETTWNYILTQ